MWNATQECCGMLMECHQNAGMLECQNAGMPGMPGMPGKGLGMLDTV